MDYLVVSDKVVDVLREQQVTHLELLPVQIFDHQDRPVQQRYTLVHPIDPVDCLDVDASEPAWSWTIEGQIRRVRQMVIDPRRVDPSRPLFRCAAYTTPKLVERSLAERIAWVAGAVGCSFVELATYRG